MPGIIAIVAFCLLMGCSDEAKDLEESESEGSRENVISIQFINHWKEPRVQQKTRVIITACGHDFLMEPEEVKSVQCIPKGDVKSVLVRVEFPWLQFGQEATIRKEVTVSDGDIVTLTSEANLEVSKPGG
jgi:hypothetical protein